MSKYTAKKRDNFGARNGTVASKVNAVMSGKWQNVEDIIKKAKAPARSVRRRLYNGAEKGIYEYERIIRFKLKRKSK